MKTVNLIKIFIASPGDVVKQRNEIEKIIWEWNNEHLDSKSVILMPVRWENNSVSSYREDTDGQAVINEQIVKSSDILIAIFWSKIGTRTSNGISGTVEEINVFFETHKKGIGIFFVNDPVSDESIKDRKMVLKYQEYLRKEKKGLYATYETNIIRRFITTEVEKLIEDGYIKEPSLEQNQIAFELENIFDEYSFDKDEQLLLLFIIEDSRQKFGARWMAQDTITNIKNWEKRNSLLPYLSERYEQTLDKLFEKGILSVKETTEYGNPRLYSISNENYKLLKNGVLINDIKVKKIKKEFISEEKPKNSWDELPF